MSDHRTHSEHSAIDDDLPSGVDLAPPVIGLRDYVPPMRERLNARAIALIEQICEEEGASITLTGPNPDFNEQPNEVVVICNDATAWEDKEYRADTIAECIVLHLSAHPKTDDGEVL